MNNKLVTICIPIGLYHTDIYHEAVASAEQQTIPCEITIYVDIKQRGAGYARNRLASTVDTPFIVFLDADDRLTPDFVEQCLKVWEPGYYVYTGWRLSPTETRIPKSRIPYAESGYHLVTTLLPMAYFNAVGGFDEDLPGHEDADLYLKLAREHYCGILIPEPLVMYTPRGERGLAFRQRSDYNDIRKQVYERNGGEQTIMCCGQQLPVAAGDRGERREGDVLAMALWAGNQTQGSVVDAARTYRGGNQSLHWVHPEDVKAFPRLWRQVHDNSSLVPTKEDVLRKAGLI